MTVAAACLVSIDIAKKKERVQSDLVVGEDQGIGNDNILPPSGIENNNFSDIIWSQRITSASKISIRFKINPNPQLTHKRHWPLTCRRKTEQRRIPDKVSIC